MKYTLGEKIGLVILVILTAYLIVFMALVIQDRAGEYYKNNCISHWYYTGELEAREEPIDTFQCNVINFIR